MAKLSAGLLMYRGEPPALEVLLVHPGGPFFAKKDAGAWSIPKGVVDAAEDPEVAARREFEEEVGAPVGGPFIPLGQIVQKGGKQVVAWAFRGDAPEGFEPSSNTFEIEWPPRSGRRQRFPEIDKARFFEMDEARVKLLAAQLPFLDRLQERLSRPPV